jgi:hypothetical protein
MNDRQVKEVNAQETLRVEWASGVEFIDLNEMRNFARGVEATIVTTEIRNDGQLAVYSPTIAWLSDGGFALRYDDPGEYDSGEAAGGDLGTASYRHHDGVWHCSWEFADGARPTVAPLCELLGSGSVRELQVIRRLKRDYEFRKIILKADDNECAVTGERLLCLLEAAHVWEVKHGGGDTRENGLTLRKDIHSLFDARLIKIDTDGVIHADKSLSQSYQALFSLPSSRVKPAALKRIKKNLAMRDKR